MIFLNTCYESEAGDEAVTRGQFNLTAAAKMIS